MSEKILLWLESHPAFSANRMEKDLGIRKSTLYRAKQDGKIPEKHIAAIVTYLKNYGFK